MLFEINSVRDIFIGREDLFKIFEDLRIKDDDKESDKEFIVDERKMLEIVTRINRCVKIMKERSFSSSTQECKLKDYVKWASLPVYVVFTQPLTATKQRPRQLHIINRE